MNLLKDAMETTMSTMPRDAPMMTYQAHKTTEGHMILWEVIGPFTPGHARGAEDGRTDYWQVVWPLVTVRKEGVMDGIMIVNGGNGPGKKPHLVANITLPQRGMGTTAIKIAPFVTFVITMPMKMSTVWKGEARRPTGSSCVSISATSLPPRAMDTRRQWRGGPTWRQLPAPLMSVFRGPNCQNVSFTMIYVNSAFNLHFAEASILKRMENDNWDTRGKYDEMERDHTTVASRITTSPSGVGLDSAADTPPRCQGRS